MLQNLASLIDSLRDPVWQGGIGIIISALIGIIGIIIPLLPPRKIITYDIVSDTPLLSKAQRLPNRLQIYFQSEPVQDPSLVVIKVRNVGSRSIRTEDYDPQLEFAFPHRQVLGSEVADEKPQGITRNARLQLAIVPGSSSAYQHDSILLPSAYLDAGDSYVVNTILSGIGKRPEFVAGRIQEGKVKRHKTRLSRNRMTIIVVSVFLMGGVLTATFLPHLFNIPPADCEAGTLTIGGSTALYPLVTQAAQKYHARCPGAVFQINQNASTSEAGLEGVESGNIQIGDSDVTALPNEADLVDHPVAVVPYVIVVNADVAPAIANITTQQLRAIYSGQLTNWHDGGLGGPLLPIYVVSRVSTSGTRQTFESAVLSRCESLPTNTARHQEFDTNNLAAEQVQSTPGAIGYVDVATASAMHLNAILLDGQQAVPPNIERNSYPFWAIEHMYTKGLATGLARAFIDYMTGDSMKDAVDRLQYINYDLMSSAALAARQQAGAKIAC